MLKLAVITTHPIQYNAPLFRLLAERKKIHLKVFYTWGETVLQNKFDPGFQRNIDWDIPLLEGYEYVFLKNTAQDKGTHHFKGIINPDIIGTIMNYRPHAILVFGWSFHSHLKVLRTFHKKIPLLFRGDSTLLSKPGGWRRIARKFFLSWVYKKIDFALYPGTRNYEYYRHAGVPDRKLVRAPHAIDNDRFTGNEESLKKEASGMRQLQGIPEAAFVFLFAAKLDDNKNAAGLLQAFVNAKLPADCHLLIVGNGELEGLLKIKYGNQPNIHFMPFQNQSAMPVIYRMAQVYVLPSKSETWGLAVNEAMASGCSILVSDRCGAAIDLIQPGRTGYTFDVHDIRDLEKKMIMLAGNRDRVTEMGKNAREVIKDFSFEKVAQTIEGLLAKIYNHSPQ